MSIIGDNIKRFREARGLTQVELADMVGEQKQNIWKYENGNITNIPLSKVEAIAHALHVGPCTLTGWDNKPLSMEVSPEEERVITLYRRADQLDRDTIQNILSRYDEERSLSQSSAG